MSTRVKLRFKKLQKNHYIIFEVKGKRVYLVNSKKRVKEIKKNYKRYHVTPF